MIKIQKESIVSILKDGGELFREHYQELEAHKSNALLAIDYNRYIAMEKAGGLVCLAVRKHGELIGYSIFSLYRAIDYISSTFANSENMFIKRSERKGHLGLNLIRLSEQELRDIGVKKINYSVRPERDFSPILKRGGYSVDAVKYSKYL